MTVHTEGGVIRADEDSVYESLGPPLSPLDVTRSGSINDGDDFDDDFWDLFDTEGGRIVIDPGTLKQQLYPCDFCMKTASSGLSLCFTCSRKHFQMNSNLGTQHPVILCEIHPGMM
jgi:hypothetical protein